MSAIDFIIKASEGQPEVIVVDEDCECTEYTAPIEILSDSDTETDEEDAGAAVEQSQAESQDQVEAKQEEQEEIADNFKTPAKFSQISEEQPRVAEEAFVPRRSARFKPSGMRQPVFGNNQARNKRSKSERQ